MTPQMMIEVLCAMQQNVNLLPIEGRDEAHSASLRAERQAAFLALKNAIECLQDYIEITAKE